MHKHRIEKIAGSLSKEELKEKAFIDPATRVYNRGFFEEYVGIEFEEMKRLDHPFSIVFLDVDGLKKINDTQGHLKGDEILRDTAKTLRERLRSSDIVARYGGDEFVVLMRGTSIEAAAVMATIEFPSSISYGIAESTEAPTVKKLIELADLRMYESRKDKKLKGIKGIKKIMEIRLDPNTTVYNSIPKFSDLLKARKRKQ